MTGHFYKFVFPLALAVLSLTACDDSSSTNSNGDSISISSTKDLPECDDSNEGLTARVESDSSIHVCANGRWIDVSDNSDGDKDYSCHTESLKDESGVKIVCAGDSVGVVLDKDGVNGSDGKNGADGKNGSDGKNGTDGVDGKDGTDGVDGKDGANGADGKDGSDGKSCNAVALKDNSGMKVVCGTDSVGVIYNGTSGAGCSLSQVGETLLRIVCGIDTATFYVHAFYDPNSSSSVASSSSFSKTVQTRDDLPKCTTKKDIAHIFVREDSLGFRCDSTMWSPDSARGYQIYSTSILGSAIKGPFQFGSPLVLREMRVMGDTLTYTGRSYVDEISSDKGNFVIPKVSLMYPYAEVSVTGLWRNEVSGKWSTDSMTLFALTDLRGDSTGLNVNLLTHFEYARVKVLVKEGYSVYAAKKQADYEILRAFGFATDVDLAENLKTFVPELNDPGNKNATLLAMSLLVMGNLGDQDILDRIESIMQDIATDGVWDDKANLKITMADWAANFDASKVRKNLKNWNVLDVPGFEKYLTDFWNNIYGLGGCDASRNGVVVKVSDKVTKVNKNKRYVCKNLSWQEAEPLEYDTYGLAIPETEGEVVAGKVNTDLYYYYASGEWHEAPGIMYDTVGWDNGDIGEVRQGQVSTDKYYIYGYNGWEQATVLQYDTYMYKDEKNYFEAGRVVKGGVHENNHYVWLKNQGKFREALQREVYVNRGCYEELRDSIAYVEIAQKTGYAATVSTDSVFKCVEGDRWELDHYGDHVLDDRDNQKYRIKTIGNQTWMVQNLNYRVKGWSGNSSYRDSLSFCYLGSASNCLKYGRLYPWSAVMDSAGLAYEPSHTGSKCGYGKTCSVENPFRGICPVGTHVPTDGEFKTLINYAGGLTEYSATNTAAIKLKTQDGWNSYENAETGTDELGFAGLPAGYWSTTSYYDKDRAMRLWSSSTSTGDNTGSAYCFYMSYASNSATVTSYYRYYSHSVRCVLDSN